MLQFGDIQGSRRGERSSAQAVHAEISPTKRALTHSLIVLPAAFVAWVVGIAVAQHCVAIDFTTSYLSAARDLFHGSSPYLGTGFVYPPPAGWLAVPFLLLPTLAAGLVATAGTVAAALATVWLMGVRDWRCFAIAFLWLPCDSVIQTGNVVIILALLFAASWRWRDRSFISGTSVGLAIALKLIAAPLVLFFLLTRRWRAAAISAGSAAAITVLSWAPIGFTGMSGYPHLLGQLDAGQRLAGYALRTLVAKPLGWSPADALVAVVAVVLVGAAFRFRRHETKPFIISVALVLELSPIVHMYYFVFLLVVIPLASRKMALIWLAPLVLWISPAAAVGGPEQWQRAAVLVAVAVIFAAAIEPRLVVSRGSEARLAAHSSLIGAGDLRMQPAPPK